LVAIKINRGTNELSFADRGSVVNISTDRLRNFVAHEAVRSTGGDAMKRASLIRAAIGSGTAAFLAVSAITPTYAAPVLSNTAAVKLLATDHAVDVRWVGGRRGGGWGGAVAAGIIGGLVLGAIASATYSYGYGPGYGYAPSPYYGYYGYPPYSPAGHFQDQFRNSY
jgi:hypothetical protein